MHILRLFIGLVATAGIVGCSRSAHDLEMIAAPEGMRVPILREASAQQSRFARSVRCVVHNAAELSRFPIKSPAIDFENEIMLIAAMGPAPGPQCDVRILAVWRRGDRLYPNIETRYPPAGERRAFGSYSPYHVIVIPRTTLPIEGFQANPPRDMLLGFAEN